MKKPSAPSLDEVRRLVPMLPLLAHYGVVGSLRSVAGQLRGTCPIHDGSNPEQFVVNARSNTWFCFGDCDRGGGTLELVSLKERVSIPRAAQLITEWFLQTSSAPRQQRRSRMSTSSRPSHRLYIVEDRPTTEASAEQQAFWHRVGAAWPQRDGKGLSIQLIPGVAVSGRLVLREYTPEQEEADSKAKRAKAK